MYIEKPKKIVLVDKNKEEGNSGSDRLNARHYFKAFFAYDK